jgi:hypothetical protein
LNWQRWGHPNAKQQLLSHYLNQNNIASNNCAIIHHNNVILHESKEERSEATYIG